ncbi:hypothetical protein ACG2Y5_001561 [Listeria monocytogenes]|uniref:Uncharacterized protein n=1 Tax=Listeria monocytogenes TaxID=1639 RepID=A0AAN2YK44_LISMN|nr:hypothetical protein [Listeria monocytogenes]EAF4500603.1 hypothetical protein [Listeria monocytogenes serotype 4b]EAF4547291.1 hypothetical protein [Listeria monocytogenes serotype 1/2a]EAC8233978.1 hypothetical protein [Listeria monocytogenes]EAC9100983.1 hypothetical protein [Listeria monocytogenes]EAD6802285.1 hypothetical protein [Listeria monocytogenes]
MTEKNLEKLMLMHKRIIENLEEFSTPAKQQMEKLKDFVVTDELASDFSDIALQYAKILFDNGWLTKEQLDMFLVVDKKLEGMSNNEDLWSDEALETSIEWAECRERGKEILKTFR